MRNVICCVATLATWLVQSPSAQAQVTITYQAPSKLVLHEPVIVEFVADNATDETIHLDLGLDRTKAFAVTISRPDGSVRTPQLSYNGIVRLSKLSIRPRDRYTQQLFLNAWDAFDQVGPYRIAINLTSPVKAEQGGAVVETSAKAGVELTVLPRDERVLQRICSRLAGVAATTTNAAERIDAARALSYISDPVAVPCVRSVTAATDRVDWILIPGLLRIANPDAQALLQDLASSDKFERAALARNGLERVVP